MGESYWNGAQAVSYTHLENQTERKYYPDESGDVKWSFFAKSQQLRV